MTLYAGCKRTGGIAPREVPRRLPGEIEAISETYVSYHVKENDGTGEPTVRFTKKYHTVGGYLLLSASRYTPRNLRALSMIASSRDSRTSVPSRAPRVHESRLRAHPRTTPRLLLTREGRGRSRATPSRRRVDVARVTQPNCSASFDQMTMHFLIFEITESTSEQGAERDEEI